MPPKLNLAGQRFGRLLVIEENGQTPRGLVMWLCRCDCGATTTVVGSRLKRGDSTSCGCRRRETRANQLRTHGMKGTRIYRIWKGIITRTTNPNYHSYAYYGGRGISVCDRWRSFENFYADMGPTYRDGLSIDRIDNDGNYEPGNCRWATRAEQTRNRRNSVNLTWQGHTLAAAEWGRLLGLDAVNVCRRIRKGWPVDRALTEGVSTERLARVLADLGVQTGSPGNVIGTG